jgi:hypothetical protein
MKEHFSTWDGATIIREKEHKTEPLQMYHGQAVNAPLTGQAKKEEQTRRPWNQELDDGYTLEQIRLEKIYNNENLTDYERDIAHRNSVRLIEQYQEQKLGIVPGTEVKGSIDMPSDRMPGKEVTYEDRNTSRGYIPDPRPAPTRKPGDNPYAPVSGEVWNGKPKSGGWKL